MSAFPLVQIDDTHAAAHGWRAASLGCMGQLDEAEAALDKLPEVMPGLTISKIAQMLPMIVPEANDRWWHGLRLAGLLDEASDFAQGQNGVQPAKGKSVG